MKKHRLFVNYRLLWKEIQDCNRYEIAHTRLLRRGNSYVLYELYSRYKNLLNKQLNEGYKIDPDHLPVLYVASSAMSKHTPYSVRSITNCLQNLTCDSYRHLIRIEPVFNYSKFKVTIPLRYFMTLGNIKSIGSQKIEDRFNS